MVENPKPSNSSKNSMKRLLNQLKLSPMEKEEILKGVSDKGTLRAQTWKGDPKRLS
jgi:hypothetical protein